MSHLLTQVRNSIIESFCEVFSASVNEYIGTCRIDKDLDAFVKLCAQRQVSGLSVQRLRLLAASLDQDQLLLLQQHSKQVNALLELMFGQPSAVPAALLTLKVQGTQGKAMLVAARMSAIYEAICGGQIRAMHAQLRRLGDADDFSVFVDFSSGLVSRCVIETLASLDNHEGLDRSAWLYFSLLHGANLNRGLFLLNSQFEDAVIDRSQHHLNERSDSGFLQTIPMSLKH